MLDLFELFHIVSMLVFHFDVVLICSFGSCSFTVLVDVVAACVLRISISGPPPDQFADQYIISG